jgi:Family of unknown function (DUF6159)
MWNRISNGWALAGDSWQLLWQDKKLIVFPLISGTCSFFVILAFCVPFLANPELLDFPRDAQGHRQVPLWAYAALFAFYFVNYFVIIFFNSALISCAVLRFNGQEASLSDGLAVAASRLPQILAWALVSATVGFLLKLIERAHNSVGEFVSAILGTAWSVITYFVVPVLVVEKVDPFTAVQRSIALLKKSWGESLVGQIGIGLIMFLLLVPAILLFLMGLMFFANDVAALGIAVMVLGVVYFLIWAAVGPAIHGIFLAALYQYASSGTAPPGFDQRALSGAFAPKAS